MSEKCCHLCKKEIVFNSEEPLPISWLFENDEVLHYCGEHAEVGLEIIDRFLSEKGRLERIEGFCNAEKLLYKIESQYKTNLGDWNIQFPNLRYSGQELLNVPILRDGKPIGFVTEVNRDYVIGRIWSRYIPIMEEISTGNHHTMSFELVC